MQDRPSVPSESTREQRLSIPVRAAHDVPAWQRVARRIHEEVMLAPLVPVLHPSPLRMKGMGLFTLVGHPLFWFVWAVWLPQPYESLPLRLLTASLGLALLSPQVSRDPSSRFAGQVFSVVLWFELPFLFSWMFFCNGGNAVWLASMAAMILIYYFNTDWRLASVGLVLAALLARVLYESVGPAAPPMSTEQALTSAMVLAFCVSMGILLGLSSANLRREHLARTLATMGIMAHELRTPLATMALIGDAVRGCAEQSDAETATRLQQLSARLHTLVRNMNHHVDMQIANARLLRLPVNKEAISASELVQHAVSQYPFRSRREREAVQLRVTHDFRFQGSQGLFLQVMDNLIKNALRSLAATSNASRPGDVRIEVNLTGGRGQIVLADRGVGIEPELQARIFDPFFSTDLGTGHGLGLAFCRRVVQAAGGSIRVKSESGQGAVFTIELPARSPYP